MKIKIDGQVITGPIENLILTLMGFDKKDWFFGGDTIIVSEEFLMDIAMYWTAITEPRTPDAKEKEILDWQGVLSELNKINWDESRKKVQFLKEQKNPYADWSWI